MSVLFEIAVTKKLNDLSYFLTLNKEELTSNNYRTSDEPKRALEKETTFLPTSITPLPQIYGEKH